MINVNEKRKNFNAMAISNKKWLFAKDTYIEIWKALKTKTSNGLSLSNYYNSTLNGTEYKATTKNLYKFNQELFDYICKEVPTIEIHGLAVPDSEAISSTIIEMRDTYEKYQFAEDMHKILSSFSKEVTQDYFGAKRYNLSEDEVQVILEQINCALQAIEDYESKAKYKTLLVM